MQSAGPSVPVLPASRALLAMFLVALWLVLPAPSEAGAYVVTRTDDPAPGVCDGDCSLREAVIAANAASDADVITLPAGTYNLTLQMFDDTAQSGDLDILNDLTINGAGAATTAINAGGFERVFHSMSSIDFFLNGVTVTGGDAEGAGIYNNSGAVYVSDSVVTGNVAVLVNGGGIYNNVGQLSVTDSTISGNTGGVNGGGIYSNGGMVTVTNTAISGNPAGGAGGGIYNSGIGVVNVIGGVISGNSALEGAGIYNTGTGDVNLNGVTVSMNTASSKGGGIGNLSGTSSVGMYDSSIVDNQANSGAGISSNGGVTIEDSSILGNDANGDAGGIESSGPLARLMIRNSTLSGNTAKGHGGGIGNQLGSETSLGNVTVTANIADSDNTNSGVGGGFWAGIGTFNVQNSIVAGNQGQIDDCAGLITSGGYNLFQDVSGCALGGDLTGVITGMPAGLAPLDDNGGATSTHALMPGSLAIDAGNPAAPGSGGTACEAADQRGVSRPIDGDAVPGARCDIGAFEASALATATPSTTPTASPTPSATATVAPTSSASATPSATPVPSPTSTATSTPAPSGTPSGQRLQGDVQCDNDIDTVDALQQLRDVAALGTFQEPGCPEIGAAGNIFGDVDCDGDVDSVDALKVLRHVAALPVLQTEPCTDIGQPL